MATDTLISQPTMQLLITDALIPKHFARDLLSDLPLPGLTALAKHAELIDAEPSLDEFQRSTPTTRWLLQAFGYSTGSADHAPIAPLLMLGDDLNNNERAWSVMTPCHFQLASDHVQLGDATPSISTSEAEALLDAARPCWEAVGGHALMGTPQRWYLSQASFNELKSAEPARALGRNISLWLPDGDEAACRAWRRLHNEIQMSWHEHPVNVEREQRGLAPINGLWLFGAGQLAAAPATSSLREPVCVGDDQALLGGLARWSQATLTDDPFAALSCRTELSDFAAREDWHGWRQALQAIDRALLLPIAERQIDCDLVFTGETTWRRWRTQASPSWLRRLTAWRSSTMPMANRLLTL